MTAYQLTSNEGMTTYRVNYDSQSTNSPLLNLRLLGQLACHYSAYNEHMTSTTTIYQPSTPPENIKLLINTFERFLQPHQIHIIEKRIIILVCRRSAFLLG